MSDYLRSHLPDGNAYESLNSLVLSFHLWLRWNAYISKIIIQYSNGKLTPRTGVAIIGEYLKGMNLERLCNENLPKAKRNNGWVIDIDFREGNETPASKNLEFIKLIYLTTAKRTRYFLQ
jgi:hypothetical protein